MQMQFLARFSEEILGKIEPPVQIQKSRQTYSNIRVTMLQLNTAIILVTLAKRTPISKAYESSMHPQHKNIYPR